MSDVAWSRMTISDFVILCAQFRQTAKLHDGGAPVMPRESAKLDRKLKFLAFHLTRDGRRLCLLGIPVSDSNNASVHRAIDKRGAGYPWH
jgi:hypothetical protein